LALADLTLRILCGESRSCYSSVTCFAYFYFCVIYFFFEV
jgi:hypothetical protein